MKRDERTPTIWGRGGQKKREPDRKPHEKKMKTKKKKTREWVNATTKKDRAKKEGSNR